MNRYPMLLNILDKIREEAAGTPFSTTYLPPTTEVEAVNQARARAFIHLYLKVSFGLLEFRERERLITDGSGDGGIDGYYIDPGSRTVYLVQSKFRTTPANFKNKEIRLDEILVMDIDRILNGEIADERGLPYNGKIKQLQREVASTEDIARYKYRIIILANLEGISPDQLRRLCAGYAAEIMNYESCYNRLVFPVVSGTFFNASDLNIYIDLSNKNAGAKISYTVMTKHGECEITALFIPTVEIAKILHKYKNSILKFNPRSYLEFEGQKVNTAIRETIINTTTNEFALFNNGITMLSDETYINERIGQKNKAQLTLKNPQIINGGQTAYTLSRILEEHPGDAPALFEGKEVLLKVITLIETEAHRRRTAAEKIGLIDQISTATNQQTVVITADRYSNDSAHIDIQRKLFERFGLLYERKRGEFADGLHKGYIELTNVLERNRFFRIFFAAQGDVRRAVEKKLFIRYQNPRSTIEDDNALDRFYFAYLCFRRLAGTMTSIDGVKRERELYAKIYALTKYAPERPEDFERAIDAVLPTFDDDWRQFINDVAQTNTRFLRKIVDRRTGQQHTVFNIHKWIRSDTFEDDLRKRFNPGVVPAGR